MEYILAIHFETEFKTHSISYSIGISSSSPWQGEDRFDSFAGKSGLLVWVLE
jgi:hypothetical protein